MTMLAQIKRLFSRYGFHRQPVVNWLGQDGLVDVADWQAHPFYTSAGDKARRLAEIARQRNALKDELAKVIKAKKARAPIYAALRALSIEELKVEGRR
jgi:hypothetical protein